MDDIKGNEFESSDFLKVLLALKDNIMRNLNVCDIGIVKEVSGLQCRCCLLNKQNAYVNCIIFTGVDVRVNDEVLIIYSNTDLKSLWIKYKNGEDIQTYISTNRHDANFGIVIQSNRIDGYLKLIDGYNSLGTQSLKNINGVLKWVND